MNQENESNTIGKRIAMLRRQKGYTQEQLAELLNISPQAVSKWENEVSSPDISLIPKIAEILDVTTDELLGVKPIEPHVVVVDTGSAKSGGGGEGFKFQFEGGKAPAIIFGMFLLAIGVVFLLQEFGVISLLGGVTFWSLAWPILLIGLGASMLRASWFPASIGCILVGAYKLLEIFVPSVPELTWNMVWPLALLLIGLSVVTSNLSRKKRKKTYRYHANGDLHEKKAHVSESCEDGVVNLECTFSEARHVFEGDEFRSANIENNFGTTTLDLRRCPKFADNASVYAEANFGSLNILLPSTVVLDKTVENVFAACTVKGTPDGNAPFRLTLRGNVNFGSIEIRY